MRPTEIAEIRRLPLFRNMMEATFGLLIERAYVQAFPAGLQLIRQGDPADFLHVLVEGSVELYASWADQHCTMGVLRPLNIFILAACIRDAPCLMSARTLERSRVLLIPAADARTIFRRDTEFSIAVIDELAAAYRDTVRQIHNLKLRTARERVAAYLLRQSQRLNDAAGFHLPFEKRFLSSYLGMTPENLSRTLKSLEGEGVKVDGARVIITDRARLESYARLDQVLDGADPAATAFGPTGAESARPEAMQIRGSAAR